MPITADRPSHPEDNGDFRPIQFGAILEKIRRGGSPALSPQERIIVVELFRACAMTSDPRALKLLDEVSAAHLEFCFRLPTTRTPHDS